MRHPTSRRNASTTATHLKTFIAETDRATDLLASILPEARALDDAETLTYLHGTISTKSHRVAVPNKPVYLDALLPDTPLSGRARTDARRPASAPADDHGLS